MPDAGVHLAQVNVSRLRFSFDAKEAAGLVAAIAIVNDLADAAPGFVWRHPSNRAGDRQMFINVSVWESYERLHEFTYRSSHGGIVRRRAEWFVPMAGPKTALWWIPAGHRPTPEEGRARLDHLRSYGPTPEAFGVRRRFDPSGRPARALHI